MTPAELREFIRDMRADGALSVTVDGVTVTFPPPAPPPLAVSDDEAVKKDRERRARTRSIDERLFDPLGIGPEMAKDDDKAAG